MFAGACEEVGERTFLFNVPLDAPNAALERVAANVIPDLRPDSVRREWSIAGMTGVGNSPLAIAFEVFSIVSPSHKIPVGSCRKSVQSWRTVVSSRARRSGSG